MILLLCSLRAMATSLDDIEVAGAWGSPTADDGAAAWWNPAGLAAGSGTVLSFAAPYECADCGSENRRVLQVSSVSPAVLHEPPEFRCPRCGGAEQFDDVAGRYFAFLKLG